MNSTEQFRQSFCSLCRLMTPLASLIPGYYHLLSTHTPPFSRREVFSHNKFYLQHRKRRFSTFFLFFLFFSFHWTLWTFNFIWMAPKAQVKGVYHHRYRTNLNIFLVFTLNGAYVHKKMFQSLQLANVGKCLNTTRSKGVAAGTKSSNWTEFYFYHVATADKSGANAIRKVWWSRYMVIDELQNRKIFVEFPLIINLIGNLTSQCVEAHFSVPDDFLLLAIWRGGVGTFATTFRIHFALISFLTTSDKGVEHVRHTSIQHTH